ncbi:MAG: DeoR/GlpR transcriptional regulator [Holdemanella sp.]|nr:DeoR/GlpR transcriptional regulator [Holdemanella sp.]
MLTNERHADIIEKLQMTGKVLVKDLCALYEVTEDCIRKDLRLLEKQGYCKRVYGGAILVKNEIRHNVYERIDKDVDKKSIIAKKAYDEIQDGETIFMDVSTTNLILAKLLAQGNKRVIVISNMIDVLTILATNPNITVIGTGGNVNLELNGFVGSITMSIVSKHHFSKCFIGTTGIDYNMNMLTTFDMEDGLVKDLVISNSTTNYILMEDAKFKAIGGYKYIDIKKVDYIITNTEIDNKYKQYLKKHAVEVL